MILRGLNFIVICALVLAAAYVYRIKFDSTVQAERLAKLRSEVRHERDDIAALRAEWGQLDSPERIETLAKRFLCSSSRSRRRNSMRSITCPDRPPQDTTAYNKDPIGGIIENWEQSNTIDTTGSIPPAPAPDAPSGAPR